jgi:HNH endonuclease
MREFKWDQPKSLAQIRKELGLTCKHPDCNKPLTNMLGPGSGSCCREHQLQLREYGGYGRLDRLHSWHRSDVCSCCGQDINDDPRWEKAEKFFGITLSDDQRNEIKRRYNHGDHQERQADGGGHTGDNVVALCSFCHWVKTVIFNDGRRAVLDEDEVDN